MFNKKDHKTLNRFPVTSHRYSLQHCCSQSKHRFRLLSIILHKFPTLWLRIPCKYSIKCVSCLFLCLLLHCLLCGTHLVCFSTVTRSHIKRDDGYMCLYHLAIWETLNALPIKYANLCVLIYLAELSSAAQLRHHHNHWKARIINK